MSLDVGYPCSQGKPTSTTIFLHDLYLELKLCLHCNDALVAY